MSTVGFIGGKFLPLHQGHVYAITQAACLCDELYVVLSHSKARDQALCLEAGLSEIPAEVRLRWLSQATKDMENVKVLSVEDRYESDDAYNWEEGAEAIQAAIGKPIDFVFSSEESYDPIFQSLYPGARHIILDPARIQFPISATQIRTEGIYKHWAFIPEVVRPFFVKKVVIVGTESCGKSTLTRYLAKIYNSTYVEEYGRTMCEELGGCDGIMTREYFPLIAYGHKLQEFEAIKKANKVVFIDTEATVTQYYSELYAQKNSPIVEAIALEQEYDLWLFLEPDVQWVDDGLRVHGEQEVRKYNNERLKAMLDEKGVSFVSISGSYHDRLMQAITAVNALLQEVRKSLV